MTEITRIIDKIYLVYIRYIPQNNFSHALVLRRKMKCIMEMDKLLYVPPQYNLFHNKKNRFFIYDSGWTRTLFYTMSGGSFFHCNMTAQVCLLRR